MDWCLKARLHRRYLSRQLDAIFVAPKLQLQNRTCKQGAIFSAICRRDIEGVWNMFETCCNFSATKIASSCCDKNRLCKRALKLRTNYGRGNQNGLLTLGNDETALSPHPVRNLTKRRKPQRSCSPWLWILTMSSTNPLPRTHTGVPRECAHGTCYLPKTLVQKQHAEQSPLFTSETEKRNLVWLLRAPRLGTENIEEESPSLNLHREKSGIARVL